MPDIPQLVAAIDGLVVIDRAARGTGFFCIRHSNAGINPRPRPPDRLAGRVTTADNRFMSVVGLLEHGDVGTVPDRGSDPGAPVIHGLSTDRARREQPADQRPLVRQRHLSRRKSILVTDRLADPTAHVIGQAIFEPLVG